MILDTQFSLPVPMEEAFDALLDGALVVASLSGARRGARVDERTVRAELRLGVGAGVIPYRGTLRVEEHDREAGAVRLSLDAREGRGKGTARGEVEIRLRESVATTVVAMRADLELSGRAERAGEAAVRAAVAGLVEELATGLSAGLARSTPAEPAIPATAAAAPPPPPPARVEPAVVVPGRVRIMTTEPVPAASVAPRDSLAETLAARPWLIPLVLAGLLVAALAVARRRRADP